MNPMTHICRRAAVVVAGLCAAAFAPAAVQTHSPASNPCATGTVYDSRQGLCWLADANLAGDPDFVTLFGVTGINPNGSMTYQAAQNWVAALNSYNNGRGFLGQSNWQLPVTPMEDTTCLDEGPNGASFGPRCTRSAMGSLYKQSLRRKFPNSVAPDFAVDVSPIHNLKLSYYWALQNDGPTTGGQETFSFANGQHGGTTIQDSYYYVLPMVQAVLEGAPSCDSRLPIVRAYAQGPFAGRAVLDCRTGFTWLADANLAAQERFGIHGDLTINYRSGSITVPKIDGGAMLFDTAKQFIQALNADPSYHLPSLAWDMPPTYQEFEQLFADLKLARGDNGMMLTGRVGPFQNLQPFFYWACERDQAGNSRSACNGALAPGTLQFTFDFDYGFESTSALDQRYFVMVYYPAPIPASTNPIECCLAAGGYWANGRCQ